MTTPKKIKYIFENLSEAVKTYHKMLDKLEKWEEKYPKYEYQIYLDSNGIKNNPTVLIIINEKEIITTQDKRDS